jgi:hypothetical protein
MGADAHGYFFPEIALGMTAYAQGREYRIGDLPPEEAGFL